jgi:1-acyl-sn-glycerol-3-phosphate acyltransferase
VTSPPRPSAVYLLVGLFSRPFLRLVFRYRATGLDHLPRDGGYVLAANHLSNFDPWALGMAVFPRRFLRFMAKSELFWFPLGPFIRSAGAFKVERGTRDVEAVRTAEQLAREGHVVAMFPEGTRRQKGLRKKWQPETHTGAARIALAADVPLVPAGVAGTDRLRRLGPVRVAYGEPVRTDDLADLDPSEAARVATDRLMRSIRALEESL